ncbi:SO2930 family diheme c-type cytochrome [Tsuneonella sp. SYSU-LHT278]|uniref:SO2930 family diheme c-type cytochrome n=1 Tax=Tsuneonella sediminis TaxID=3416089 RepID=UPI003F7951DC
MIRSIALPAAAVAALLGALTAQATPVGSVDQSAILDDGMPRSLSEFGFFADPVAQVPGKSVVPYRLNTPLWSDGADKLRFVYVPPGKQARADGEGLLDFPVGSALIKTFAFQQDGKRRLIETRVLLRRASDWVALPYLWNAEQTEATLAIAGARVPLTTPGGEDIEYRVPNKNQCKECHGLQGAVVPIGPKAANLSEEWLAAFRGAGHMDAVPKVAARMPLWEERSSAPVEAAARGYLDVNCAHCHRPGGSASNSGLDLRWQQADPGKLGVMKRPVAAGRGAGDFLFDIVPGEPGRSILVHRMGSLEGGVAMPELGKATIDHDGLDVVKRWIAGLVPVSQAPPGGRGGG